MTQLPDRPRAAESLPERRLSPEQFEQVIRRAAELQALRADDRAEGISEAELMRIGREIGISPQHIQQALAESAGRTRATPTLAERVFGPGEVEASRAVVGPAESVREQLDRYLIEREWLSVLRRLPDRTVYHRAPGTDLARAFSQAQEAILGRGKQPVVGAGFKLRNARRVEVSVQPLEEGYSFVVLRLDVSGSRATFATAGVTLGGAGMMGVAAALAVAIDPPAALLAAPVGGGALWGFRAAQTRHAAHAQTHLESLLDCLERGEPLVRPR